MQRACEQLLAGSRLSQNADASLAGRHTFDLCHKSRHSLTAPYQFMLAQGSVQLAILAFQAREPHGVFESQEKLVGGDGLFQKIDRSKLGCTNRHLHVRLPGHHDHRRGHA